MKQKLGFTLIEILVVLFIIGLMTTMVMVNFRVGENASRFDGALRQLVGTFEEVRIWSQSGKISNGSFPANGYAVNFVKDSPEYLIYEIAADFSRVTNSRIVFPSGIKISDICYLDKETVADLPCAGQWKTVALNIFINFTPGAGIIFETPGYEYAGGIIQDEKSGRRAYFYISYDTGLVVSGKL